jgi:hypothetical protein
MVADPMVRRAQPGYVAAPASLLALANCRQPQVTARHATLCLIIEGLCRARTRTMALSWCFLRSSGRSPILVDQPVEDLLAPDPAGDVDRLAGFM